MPELPELEVIKNKLNENIRGEKIEDIRIKQPLVFRCLVDEFKTALLHNSFLSVGRRGKFLIFNFEKDVSMVINLMLAGRIQYCKKMFRIQPKTCLQLFLSNGMELRYFDRKLMGRIYLAQNNDFSQIPQFMELGLEPLATDFDLEVFREGLKKRWGMIKNVLTNQRFIAGIGNAYSDEILFDAEISPLRKTTTLLPKETEKLYFSIKKILADSIEIISQQIGEDMHKEKRDFFKVHGRGGQNCSKCVHPITELKPDGKLTNYCRVCQK